MASKHTPLDDLNSIAATCKQLYQEVARVVVQEDVVEPLVAGMLMGEHCLLVGVSGLSKSRLPEVMARALGLSYHRIRMTPDLTPADLIGVAERAGDGGAPHGPLFHHVVLADQIDQAAPRVLSVLLDAMERGEFMIGPQVYRVPSPFFLFASTNPNDFEGPAVLGESQSDCFGLQIQLRYPSYQEECELAIQVADGQQQMPSKILDGAQLLDLQQRVRDVHCSHDVLDYAVRLARATRTFENETLDFIYEWVRWGAGPRGVQSLLLAAKARALLRGRAQATIGDVQAMLHAALCHRVRVNQNATSQGVTSDQVMERLILEVPVRLEDE